MRSYTIKKRYWRAWPWPPGWHTKTVTVYEYYFPKIYVNQWGVFTRGFGCEEDGKWYAFTDPALAVFGSTYYCGYVRKVEDTPLKEERSCPPEFNCVDPQIKARPAGWDRIRSKIIDPEERGDREAGHQ
jgi:hypothetical protein